MPSESVIDAGIPRYETAHRLTPEFDFSVVDEADLDEVPAGVDLYLVFLEPAAM